MSSKKNRHFLNSLCSISDEIKTNYLEIGVWKGSTFLAANYKNNNLESIAIDSWAGWGGPKDVFESGCKKHLRNMYGILSFDSFSPDVLELLQDKKFDIYFYDGAHSYEAQRDAFKFYTKNLGDLFICVVDDWKRPEVRKGTRDAFDQLNYTILYEKEIFSNQNDPEGYWEGLYIGLIKQNNKY